MCFKLDHSPLSLRYSVPAADLYADKKRLATRQCTGIGKKQKHARTGRRSWRRSNRSMSISIGIKKEDLLRRLNCAACCSLSTASFRLPAVRIRLRRWRTPSSRLPKYSYLSRIPEYNEESLCRRTLPIAAACAAARQEKAETSFADRDAIVISSRLWNIEWVYIYIYIKKEEK